MAAPLTVVAAFSAGKVGTLAQLPALVGAGDPASAMWRGLVDGLEADARAERVGRDENYASIFQR